MRLGKERVLDLYVVAVAAAGLALLPIAAWPFRLDEVRSRPVEFAALFVLLTVAEFTPIRLGGKGRDTGFLASTSFSFALLLSYGPWPAVLAHASACMLADLSRKKGWRKTLLNVGQYNLALSLAGLVFRTVASVPLLSMAPQLQGRDLAALVLAAIPYFLVNVGLIGVAIALDHGLPVLKHVRWALVQEAGNHFVVLGLAPIVALVADRSVPLIALLLLPVLAVYRSARIAQEKEYQAWHDSLTDLPNRLLFQDRVEEALHAARQSHQKLAVMLVDLDRFKEINDTIGHQAGDELLREVGPRLQGMIEEIDTVSRLGGDEFALLLTDVRSQAETVSVADRLIKALEEPFSVQEFKLHIEASIGIALYPEHGADVTTLLQRADVAMYLAKESHSNYELYSAERDRYSRKRLSLFSELKNALFDHQLVLHFQPKVALTSGETIGVEVLTRWEHPQHGLVPPNEFLPLAEHTGLIRPLTHYVLEGALRQARSWLDEGLEIPVAVNLSVRNLHDVRLPQEVQALLDESALPPSLLELEITESTIMADPPRARSVLTTLGDMGIRLSIDDFGTGYSSLAYLQRLPVQEIKVDKSFVLNVARSESDRVIVQSTIDLGRNLGLDVVAEGVEDQAAWDFLREHGCGAAQGYFITKPVPADALVAWLDRNRSHSLVKGVAGSTVGTFVPRWSSSES